MAKLAGLQNASARFENSFAIGVLVLSAVVPAVLGNVSPFILLFYALIYSVISFFRAARPRLTLDLTAKAFIVVFMVQVVLAALSARTPYDVLFGLNFFWLLLYAPSAALISRTTFKRPVTLFARVCLAGSLVALVAGFVAVSVFGFGRGEFGRVNANELSGLALLFGFLALSGVLERDDKYRLVLLLGPLAAMLVILITGSRGALLAFVAMAVFSLWFLSTRKTFLLAVLGGGAAAVAGIVVLSQFLDVGRVFGTGALLEAVLTGQAVADQTTNLRLIMYQGGIQAFLQSPLYGHGWANIMQAVLPFIPEGASREQIIYLPQLHNDVVNFLVTGGVVGLVTYLVLLIAPLRAAWRSGSGDLAKAKKLAVSLMVICYATRGLTDLMLGFDYGTGFYVMVLAAIFGLFREKPDQTVQVAL